MKPRPKIEWIGVIPDSGPSIIDTINDVLGQADEKTIGNIRFHSIQILRFCEGTSEIQVQIWVWGSTWAVNRLKRGDSRWRRLYPADIEKRASAPPPTPPAKQQEKVAVFQMTEANRADQAKWPSWLQGSWSKIGVPPFAIDDYMIRETDGKVSVCSPADFPGKYASALVDSAPPAKQPGTPPGPHTGSYRKRPLAVEAFQMTQAAREDNADWPQWLHEAWNKEPEDDGAVGPWIDFLAVNTLEGKLGVSPGDWIIRGVKGELYPCKPDIFEMTYEAIAGDEQEPKAPPEDASEPQDEPETPSEAPAETGTTSDLIDGPRLTGEPPSDSAPVDDGCPTGPPPPSVPVDAPEPAATNEAPQPDATAPAIALAKKHGIPLGHIIPRGKTINKFDVTKAMKARKAEKGDG